MFDGFNIHNMPVLMLRKTYFDYKIHILSLNNKLKITKVL